MMHVIITEGSKVLLSEDYEAFLGVGAGNDEADALGFVRTLETYKMKVMIEGLLHLAEHYAKITDEAEDKSEETEDSDDDQN